MGCEEEGRAELKAAFVVSQDVRDWEGGFSEEREHSGFRFETVAFVLQDGGCGCGAEFED